ncbi:hypothetical protein D1B33_15260 [Lysinibacillus yapensis]|uniref:Cysteine-rich VLP domain-containing protein n=1 Tax=Ureibacillus yapensis TaxID=2304605 RepID=A0A396S3X8_9BACL|nr:cysteine-rich VLP protein [Lysinibacillus yapensis]RHW33404.1 hypothetical protein D1B33_15260 [Lysinibacillus yapensis]
MLLDNRTLTKVKRLCKNKCANYIDGNCLLTESECDYFTKYGNCISCDWFEEAVLPNDPELQTAYEHLHGISYRENEDCYEVPVTHFSYKPCKRCEKQFKPTSRVTGIAVLFVENLENKHTGSRI